MTRGRRIPFLLPLFSLCFLLSPALAAEGELLFRGFSRHDPRQIVPEWRTLPPEEIRSRLLESGHFRSVDLVQEGNWVLAAVEYPLVRHVRVSGSTLHSPEWICRFFGLQPGEEYNRTLLAAKAREFQAQSREAGFTHVRLGRLAIDDLGEVLLEVEEGRVRRVEAAAGAIDEKILNRFFRACLGRPFNVHDARLALEELQYTGAFTSLDSRVQDEDGEVVLRIEAERKGVEAPFMQHAYAQATGYLLDSGFDLVKKDPRLRFLEARLQGAFSSRYSLVRLSTEQDDYRRRVGKSFFSLATDTGWLHPLDDRSHFYHLFFKGSFGWKPLEPLLVALHVRGGFATPRQEGGVRFATLCGLHFALSYSGLLDRMRAEAWSEFEQALFEPFRRGEIGFFFERRWQPGWSLQVEEFWHRWYGEGFPFLPPELPAGNHLLLPEMVLEPRLLVVYAEAVSPYLGRLVRLGAFAQTVDTGKRETLFGAKAVISIFGLPITSRLFWHREKLHFSIAARFAL